MKFVDIQLKAYGGFEDKSLAFANNGTGDGAGVHLVVGPNEAGKSTLLRGLSNLLFGFGQRGEDDWRFDLRDLRVGATLESDGGNQLAFYRKRGNRDTLIDAKGNPLPPDALLPYTQKAQRDFFEMVFGLDHHRLRQGGQELAHNQGDLAQGLFSVGSGVSGLREALDGMETQAANLFVPRGSKPRFNQLDKLYKDKQREIKSVAIGASKWKQVSDQLEQEHQRQRALDKQLEERQAEITRLERIHRNLSSLPRHTALREQLEALHQVPLITQPQMDNRRKIQEVIRAAQSDRERCAEDIALLEVEKNTLPQDEAILAKMGGVIHLRDERAKMESITRTDLPETKTELRVLDEKIKALLKQAYPEESKVPELSALPYSAVLRMVRDLIIARNILEAEEIKEKKKLLQAQRDLQQESKVLEALPPLFDIAPLDEALNTATEEASLEVKQEELRAELTQLKATLAQQGKALPLWSKTPEDLAGLKLPLNTSIDQFEREWNELEKSLSEKKGEIDKANITIQESEAECDSLSKGQELPTLDAVHQMRQARDAGWKLLRRAYIDTSEDVSAEAEDYDPEHPLPEAYEHRVRLADQLDDLRLTEADRLARYEAAKVNKEKALGGLKVMEQTHEALLKDQKLLTKRWEDAWSALEATPLPPSEMKAWSQTRQQLLDILLRKQEAQLKLEGVNLRLSEVKKRLLAVLPKEDGKGQQGDKQAEKQDETPLKSLVLRARRQLEEIRALKGSHQTHMQEITGLSHQIAQKEDDLKDLADKLAKWHNDWVKAMSSLRRPVETSPAEALVCMDQLEEIQLLAAKRSDLPGRVNQMETFASEYLAQLDKLLDDLAPDLKKVEWPQAVRELEQRLKTTENNQNRHAKIDKILEQKNIESRDAEYKEKEARGELAALMAEWHCEDESALGEIEGKARKKAELQSELQALESTMVETNSGMDLAAIAREIEASKSHGLEADAIPGRLDSLGRENQEDREALQGVNQRVGALRAELEEMDGNDSAALLAQDAEAALAEMETLAGQYLHLKLANALTRQALARYQETHRDPLLKRAGEHFKKLTLGNYEGLTFDYLESAPVLLAVPEAGRTLELEALSDGTLDQVFLALRLAVVERYLEGNEALPLVLDDILVNFDDARAAAALKILAELGGKTQVLFLTHHPHMVELAQAHLGKEHVSVQHL